MAETERWAARGTEISAHRAANRPLLRTVSSFEDGVSSFEDTVRRNFGGPLNKCPLLRTVGLRASPAPPTDGVVWLYVLPYRYGSMEVCNLGSGLGAWRTINPLFQVNKAPPLLTYLLGVCVHDALVTHSRAIP